MRAGGTDRVETSLTTYTLGANLENLTYVGTQVFIGIGNGLNNVIIGDSGNDQLSGLDGDDTLRAGNGDDTLVGGNGNDWLVGDAGASFVTTTAKATYGTNPISLSMTLPEIATATSTTVTDYINNAALSEGTFNLAFVLDVSNNMNYALSGSTVGDLNRDGASNTKLDAAISGFEALVASLQAAGLGSQVRISPIPFSDSGSVAAQGNAVSDSDGNGVAEVIDAARNLRTIGGTNYDGGLSQAVEYFAGAQRGNHYVFFLSDGQPNSQNYAADLTSLRDPGGINASIRSLGFETASYYDTLDLLDDNILSHNVIDVLAPTDLTAGLLNSQVKIADIARLEIFLNGVEVASLTPDQLTETPFGLKYSYSVSGLDPAGADKIETRIVLMDPAAGYISTSQVISAGALNSDDRLLGGAGNDTLGGGAGVDTLIGGLGDDVYQVESAADVIAEGATRVPTGSKARSAIR